MAFQLTSEVNKSRELDPLLGAIADFITDAAIVPHSGADLTDFTEKNVIVIAPEAVADDITAEVKKQVSKHQGLSLLVIGGSAKNPDKEAPGPRATVELELQLYVHPRLRPKGSRTALELVVALMRGLHDAQVRITGFAFYEEITWTGYEPLPDDDFTAYSITFEREMSV